MTCLYIYLLTQVCTCTGSFCATEISYSGRCYCLCRHSGKIVM